MSPTTPVRTHRHALHVAGAQGPPLVKQAPLDQRGVSDQLGAVPHQRMHAPECVFPVLLGHVVEDGVQEPPGVGQDVGVQLGGVGGTQLDHPASVPGGAVHG